MVGNVKITPMMEQYLRVKSEYKDYLLFYRMGDFYEMFFSDAELASKALDIALTSRGTYMDKPIPMCGIPYHAFSSYIPKLVNKGFKIAVCDQIETPDEARQRGGKAVVKREVTRIITSGTLTEESLLPSNLNNYLMAVFSLKNKSDLNIYVAITDISTGEFKITSFINNAAVELLSYTITTNPSEILVSNDILDNTELTDWVNKFKDKFVLRPITFFDPNVGEKTLQEFYNVSNIKGLFNLNDIEMGLCGAVLNYVKLTQIQNIPNLSYPEKLSNNSNLKLDAFTIKNLEIFNSLDDSDYSNNATLFGIMDKTRTPMGKRFLKKVLSFPLTDAKIINDRLDVVDFFFQNISFTEDLRVYFSSIFDIERILARISCNRASPRDIQNIGITFNIVKLLKDKILSLNLKEAVFEKVKYPSILTEILDNISDFEELSLKIQNTIIEDAPFNMNQSGYIKPECDKLLCEYSELSQNAKKIILDLSVKYANLTGISQIKIKYNNIIGYFIDATPKQAEILYNYSEKYGFKHKQTLVNGTRFTTNELQQVEQKILMAEEKYAELEQKIFKGLCSDILKQVDSINRLSKAVANLDLFTSFAISAHKNNYVKPVIDDSFAFNVIDVRHPVVEKYLFSKDKSFIPNDCILQNDDKDNTKVWLLTGPNMAGKSTFLRQNALVVIMAQTGSFVPASFAHIGIVNKLYSRVGASDNLVRGESTFMVEMSETASILNSADDKSFVILDEIGRGTATFDGMAIAASVLEYLDSNIKCRALFATHYHELTSSVNLMKNVSTHTMDIKEYNGDIVFMHKVINGVADKSYGIHVAKLAGIPDKVINRAKAILNNLENSNTISNSDFMKLEPDLFSFNKSGNVLDSSYKLKYYDLVSNIKNIDLDNTTPKSALDSLYNLKQMIN